MIIIIMIIMTEKIMIPMKTMMIFVYTCVTCISMLNEGKTRKSFNNCSKQQTIGKLWTCYETPLDLHRSGCCTYD